MTAPTLPGGAPWRLPPDPPPPPQAFFDRALPTLLRRLRLWKGLRSDRHQDVIEDLLQELWLDYLTHEQHLLALTARERHARWFRLLTRSHYRWREQGQGHCRGDALQELVHEPAAPGTSDGCLDQLPAHERLLLSRLEEQACYLKNGRLNTQATARRLRISPQTIRRLWEHVAEATGFGRGFLEFWCRRLGEALLCLGIDLLQDRPDWHGRLQRIHRIRTRLCQRPLPMHLKQMLVRYRRGARDLHPSQVLADAAGLRPDDAAAQLWLFEAACADHDLALAARSLRAARRAGAGNVPVLLLRARLLAARGRWRQAQTLLQRNLYRYRADRRLQEALHRLATPDASVALLKRVS
ncbi:MAG: hypothetical protein ACYTKC_15665 [Planctomycetota bacterium]|jgi:hypothetical protein